MAPGLWPSLSKPLWIRRMASVWSVDMETQNPPLGRVGDRFSGGLGGASVGAAALEGLEHHIPHGADVGFDAFQPVGIGLAVIGALLVGPLALEVQFPVEPLQHRLVGEGLAGDGGGDGKTAADQRGDGGGQAVVAEGLADLLQDGGAFVLS
jgi:hypothetical protein